MDTLILALQLFTGIPINKAVDVTDERLIRGVAVWPLVGLVVGAFDALIFFLASRILPFSIAAAFAVMAELWITRGFHLDGLCDTTDAFFSSRTRERMLEIMKDSHIGTFGVVAAILDLGFKYILILETGMPVFMLIAGPVAGKMVQGLCMYKTVYPRENGLGKSYIGRIPAKIMVIGAVLGGVITAACMYGGSRNGIWALILPIGCLIFAYIVKKRMVHVIGGMTGDTLGAASEMTEIFCMILILVLEGV